ncbi:unnamed protein product [Effrenium voratum]|uniref:Metalloendopeptidase n=1 Tax=Effrenium voratum TaxID=2562239 RepID=A0AA36HJC7_9DINO|nr:unnamed protein product [Effrenium voratum]CAJ1415074.1 unnamed protein product [Effrenium voratum]
MGHAVFAAVLGLAQLTLARGSCFLQGMSYMDPSVSSTVPNGAYMANVELCQSACAANVDCHYFSWYAKTGGCFLLGANAHLISNGGVVSGPKVCPTPEVSENSTGAGAEVLNQTADYAKAVEKVQNLAKVMQQTSKDPTVQANAEKVLLAAAAGQLPDRATVNSVLNAATENLDLKEAEKLQVAITVDDLNLIGKDTVGGEEAESGSFGAGAPWTDAVVQYCFDPYIDPTSLQNTKTAMSLIQRAVPGILFRLVKAGTGACQETPSVHITSDKPGCYADIGMNTWTGSSQMNLQSLCSAGVAVHELLHVLGMAHEQARPDRDQYVTVVWENIRQGMKPQFDIQSNADTARPYDPSSIMHYGQYEFSGTGRPTLVLSSKGRSLLASGMIGQRQAMSQTDVAQLRDHYNCKPDSRGIYSECKPVAAQTDLLPILLGVAGVLAAGGVGLYCFFCVCRRKAVFAGTESRPMLRGQRR